MKLVQDKKHRVFFTSDTHFGHKNICRGVSEWDASRGWDSLDRRRDFDTLDQMNDAIVNNINAVVGQDDTLVHLGDWSFGGYENIAKFRSRLFVKNIILVYGNHDHHIKNDKVFKEFHSDVDGNLIPGPNPGTYGDGRDDYFGATAQQCFTKTEQYLDLTVVESLGDKAIRHKFICFHYPIASWDLLGAGAMHLHGHIHTPHQMKLGPGKMIDVGMDGHPEFRPYSLHEVLKLLKDRPLKSALSWHNYDRHQSAETYK